MKYKEVVWVFGTSAAGKQTFISKVTQDESLAEKFGWKDNVIQVCQESVDYPGSNDMPDIVRIRKNIPEKVTKQIENSDVVLIKWQYIDSYCESPQNLMKLLPDANHRIILLKAPPMELEQRLNTKDWWQDKWSNTAELVEEELQMVSKFVDELQDSFEITIVDSGKDDAYRIVSRPKQSSE